MQWQPSLQLGEVAYLASAEGTFSVINDGQTIAAFEFMNKAWCCPALGA